MSPRHAFFLHTIIMTIADTFTFAEMVYYLTNWKVNSNNFIFFSLIKNVAKSSGEPIIKPSLSLVKILKLLQVKRNGL